MHTILAITVGGRWHLGIGDPTVMGWVTVAAYFLAAILCGLLMRRTWRQRPDHWPTLVAFWGGVALAMLLLGINKQLDLQSLFTQVARDLAKEQGWYDERLDYQRKFILWLVILGVGGFAILFLFLIDVWQQAWIALFGLSFLLVFIIARASSFHHVDQFLGLEWIGMKMNWLLELGGIGCIGLSAAPGLLPERLS
jgi:hypothetical protein